MRDDSKPSQPAPQPPVKTSKGTQKPPVKFTDWASI